MEIPVVILSIILPLSLMLESLVENVVINTLCVLKLEEGRVTFPYISIVLLVGGAIV